MRACNVLGCDVIRAKGLSAALEDLGDTQEQQMREGKSGGEDDWGGGGGGRRGVQGERIRID